MSGARRTLGFSWPALVALAALAAPRVALHDLGVVPEGTIVAALLAVGPPLCWVAAVLWRRPPRPFLTLVVVGRCTGCSSRSVTRCSGTRRWGWTRQGWPGWRRGRGRRCCGVLR
ncbi:hypothetical protein [Micromonospora chalcea]